MLNDQKTTKAQVGDVIFLSSTDCESIGGIFSGKYVVELAEFRGGWFVQARLLDDNSKYDPTNPDVQFHQCDGYVNFLLSVELIGHMQKTFV